MKMKKVMKTLALILIVVIELAWFGCATVQDVVTPAWIDPVAAEYADVNIPSVMPYTSLYDAKAVLRGMNFKHTMNQLMAARAMEDDDLLFKHIKDEHILHIKEGQEFQQEVFSPTGPIGIALASLGFGTLGTIAGGRLIPRKREKELEAEIEKLYVNNNA